MEYMRVDVNFDSDKMEPFFSKKNFDFHYGVLYKNYVTKANDGNKSDFVLGGVQLHELFFEQLQEYSTDNFPHNESLLLINNHFDTFEEFKQEFINAAMALQGSGWIYLSQDGEIKSIFNHKPTDDVVLIVDCWEHSFYLDHGPDKLSYYYDFWDFVNWDKVNERIIVG